MFYEYKISKTLMRNNKDITNRQVHVRALWIRSTCLKTFYWKENMNDFILKKNLYTQITSSRNTHFLFEINIGFSSTLRKLMPTCASQQYVLSFRDIFIEGQSGLEFKSMYCTYQGCINLNSRVCWISIQYRQCFNLAQIENLPDSCFFSIDV